MNTIIYPKLPNPDSISDPNWNLFNDYLNRNAITGVKHSVLKSYQHAAIGRFLSAQDLNHCLTLEGAGSNYSSYESEDSVTPEELLGSLENFVDPGGADFTYSREELDKLFATNGIHFDETSVVYKGIGNDLLYEYLNLSAAKVGELVTFHGFLSTSVCRENAERFANSGILLVFSSFSGIRALVPPNEAVPHSPTGMIPEHEILLDRQQTFTVLSVANESMITNAGKALRVLVLEANQ